VMWGGKSADNGRLRGGRPGPSGQQRGRSSRWCQPVERTGAASGLGACRGGQAGSNAPSWRRRRGWWAYAGSARRCGSSPQAPGASTRHPAT